MELRFDPFDRREAERRLPEIFDVLDDADSRIQRGIVAPYFSSRVVELDDEAREQLARLEEPLASLLALGKSLAAQEAELKASLAEIVRGVDLKGAQPIAPLLQVSTPHQFDASAALEELQQLMIPTDACMTEEVKRKIDADVVKELCATHGIPLEKFTRLGLTTGLSRRSGAPAARIAEIRSAADRAVRHLISPTEQAEPSSRQQRQGMKI